MSAICGGVSSWARRVRRCYVCKGRRRGLTALVFGGYGSMALCGGCGTCWSDGERMRVGKRKAERNREAVRRCWPAAESWEQHVARVLGGE